MISLRTRVMILFAILSITFGMLITGTLVVRSAAVQPIRASNPQASAATNNVLNYIASLSDPARTSNRVIVGQFGAYGDGEDAQSALESLQRVYNMSGKWPALTGMDYHHWDVWHQNNFTEPNTYLIDQWNRGMLVTVSWHMPNPWTRGESGVEYGQWDFRSVRQLITPGSSAYNNYMLLLDNAASGLAQLRDAGVVVIWRPFHEMNGAWFWWHSQTKEDYVALWQHMYNYYTYNKGLNNLLWAYSPNVAWDQWATAVDYYYPGAQYVDIVGMDVYFARFQDTLRLNDYNSYNQLAALNKPMGLLEFGPSPASGAGWQDPPYDYSKLVRDIRSTYPKLVLFQAWEWIWQIGRHTGVPQLMEDPWSISMDEVPNFRTGQPIPTNTVGWTRTATSTSTLTRTATSTLMRTATFTPSHTPSKSPTPILVASRTFTPTSTYTKTLTRTPQNTATKTVTRTPSRVPSNTFTPSKTMTHTPSKTNTPSRTPIGTLTRTPTQLASATPSKTLTPSFTATKTATKTLTRTATKTVTKTATKTATKTLTRTATKTNTPTKTLTRTATKTATKIATNTPTRVVTGTRTITRTPTKTATRIATGTQAYTPTRTPTMSGSPTVTNTPVDDGSTLPTTFHRAVNIFGRAMTIDGRTWEGLSAPNVELAVGSTACKQTVPLIPATDSARAEMIRCYLTGANVRFNVWGLPQAYYHVYIYVWEDDAPSSYTLIAQSGQAIVPYNSGAAGTWKRLGPLTLSVGSSGGITIETFGGAANISGIEIWRVTSGAPGTTPTATPSLMPTVGTPLPLTVVLETDAPQVARNGNWTAQPTTNASGGSYLYSNAGNLTLRFTGTQFDVLYVKHKSLGRFAIEVDGIMVMTVQSNSSLTEFKAKAQIRNLSPGTHTVRIYPVYGTAGIDAFVFDSAAVINP
jgi:mannan endo-1,4-beta-mannosidase